MEDLQGGQNLRFLRRPLANNNAREMKSEFCSTASKAGLAAHKAGTSKVYEVSIPGKQQTMIGVALAGPEDYEYSGGAHIMSIIDFQPTKYAGFLPHEILVSGGKVYAQPESSALPTTSLIWACWGLMAS